MPFIGKQPDSGGYQILDAMTASATASYTMQINGANFEPGSANQLIVSLNGVIQKPGSSFTISGSTLTFSSALTSSDSIDFVLVLGDTLDIGTPSDATITSAKLANANLVMPNSLDMNGKELILDIDGDTSITADTDDVIDFKIAGSDRGNIHYDGNDFFSLESNDYLTLVQNQTAERGIIFGPTYFKPYNANDNQLDLGIGAARWKDLYLSGGAYIGGTGSANHLDDYEEGTWTPALFGSSTAGSFSATSATGSYVKIGRFVHGFFSVQAGTLSGFGGFVRLGGFPFTAQSGGGGYLTYVEGQSFTFTSSTNNTTVFLEGSSSSANYNIRPQHAGTNYDKFVTGLTDGSIDGYYRGLIQCITTA